MPGVKRNISSSNSNIPTIINFINRLDMFVFVTEISGVFQKGRLPVSDQRARLSCSSPACSFLVINGER